MARMEGRMRSSGSISARGVLLVACLALAALGASWAWKLHARPPRPRYVLVNETGRHDFDLALRMSLSLAEKKSGIENALVLLASLPPGKTIEEAAADYFSRLRIGERRNGRGVLYLYSARENLMKIEVSYALEGDIPDAYCRGLEEAARTYMLSEVPQDFVSELIITTNLRGMGTKDADALSRPRWMSDDFLSGGAAALPRLARSGNRRSTRAAPHEGRRGLPFRRAARSRPAAAHLRVPPGGLAPAPLLLGRSRARGSGAGAFQPSRGAAARLGRAVVRGRAQSVDVF